MQDEILGILTENSELIAAESAVGARLLLLVRAANEIEKRAA
jgi:hypothetical protein